MKPIPHSLWLLEDYCDVFFDKVNLLRIFGFFGPS